MPADIQEPSLAWLLGRDRKQRRDVRYWLMTSGVYAGLLALQAYAVTQGLGDGRLAGAMPWVAGSGLVVFYAALRSGWSQRFADSALTAAQMVFALLMVALAHLATPGLGEAVLVIPPLILLFGAFTLTPRHCRALGWFAVAVQGGVSWLQGGEAGGGSQARVEVVVFLMCAIVYPMVGVLAGRLSAIRTQLREQKRDLREALERNQQLARLDDLTGLPNRRHAMELLAYEERRAQRQPVMPCLCLLDIDHFKAINDTHGHPAGDEALRLLARHAVKALRAPDLLARWGGEEFLLLMPDTTMAEALGVLERLRQVLAQPEPWSERPELKLTFSAGVTAYQAGETMQQALTRADGALYQAKQQGRNCAVQA